MTRFPDLPIVTPDPPRKSQAEKYGGLFYLGSGGLACLVLMIAWFGYGVWSMRSVWSDIYVLNDPQRPEIDRVNAAWRLSRDPRVTQRQRWDLALSRTPPELARYLLAESLTSEATQADPRAFALAASRSEGWPPWLHVLLARPLAYEAGEGGAVDLPSIEELGLNRDPAVVLFADFALVVMPSGKGESHRPGLRERRDDAEKSFDREFVRLLDRAEASDQPERAELLDRATLRLRSYHPDAARIWSGWAETPGGMIRSSAPKLPAVTP